MRRRGPARRGVSRGARMAVRMMARRHRRRRRRRVVLVGGLIAVGAHKLSKRDVERVEEHTGKTAEELSDEELDQAMNELNIPENEMTDEELDYVDKEDPDSDSDSDYIQELERLSSLRDQGIISDEEFEAKKKQLLGL